MMYLRICSRSKVAIAMLSLALGVTSILHAAPPNVHVQRKGSNVVVNFIGRLQSAERTEGPYASVVGALSPHAALTSSASPQFWRAVLSDVRSIAAGDRFTLAVRNDGTLWAWGSNGRGQLGVGTTNDVVEPVQVGADANWRTVSEGAGAHHALAIRDDGTLWAWGDNRFGQLGLGHTNDVHEPVQVGTNTIWESVAAGWRHTIALRTDGTLWAIGDNRFGQLGIGTTNNVLEPVQVGTDANWQAVSASVGDPFNTFYADRLERRYSHTIALRNDGTLWAWGNNQAGQLGIGSGAGIPPYGVPEPTQVGVDSDWRAVSAGGYHTLALRADGSLWGWGSNGHGQLGIGENMRSYSGTTNVPVPLGANENWQTISAGGSYSMAVRPEHSLWAWGDNRGGQLGIETSANEYGYRYIAAPGYPPWQVGSNANWKAIVAGQSHTVALRDDGSIWTWGSGGLGRNVFGSAQDVQVGIETNWLTVDAGLDFTIAMRADGTLWSWGWNEKGYLGTGRRGDVNQPTQIGADTNWASVDAGNTFCTAIRTDGTLWVWGWSQFGLGIGTNSLGDFSPQPAQVGTNTNWRTVSASGQTVEIPYDQTHIVALRDDGTLWSWGSHFQGQLGLGEIGANIVYEPRQVGTNTNWRLVSAGWMHTMAIREDGTLWGWGRNFSGELGIGTSEIDKTNRPVQVGTDTNWAAVSALRFYNFALRTDGTRWAWGLNYDGRLGVGSTTTEFAPVQVGTAIDWRHVATDDNHFYREGADPAAPWRSIASGWRHFVGILHDGTLWASGNNFVGQIAQPVPWLPYPVVGDDWGLPGD